MYKLYYRLYASDDSLEVEKDYHFLRGSAQLVANVIRLSAMYELRNDQDQLLIESSDQWHVEVARGMKIPYVILKNL